MYVYLQLKTPIHTHSHNTIILIQKLLSVSASCSSQYLHRLKNQESIDHLQTYFKFNYCLPESIVGCTQITILQCECDTSRWNVSFYLVYTQLTPTGSRAISYNQSNNKGINGEIWFYFPFKCFACVAS